ncbi:MAG: sulfite exporter TauE/SafE family protein [Bacillota bacterium]
MDLEVAFSIVAALMAGIIKTTFGIGAGVFLTPLLSLVLDPKTVVALMAPMMLITDISTLWLHKNKWDLKYINILTPGFLGGVLAGSYYLAWASPSLTKLTIGIIAMVFSAYQIIRLKYPNYFSDMNLGTPAGVFLSLVGGMSSAIAHSGGIIVTIYLVTKNLSKSSFVATLVGMLFFSDILKMFTYTKLNLLNKSLLITGLELTPVLFLGSWLGSKLINKITEKQFILYVNLLIFISGVILTVRH